MFPGRNINTFMFSVSFLLHFWTGFCHNLVVQSLIICLLSYYNLLSDFCDFLLHFCQILEIAGPHMRTSTNFLWTKPWIIQPGGNVLRGLSLTTSAKISDVFTHTPVCKFTQPPLLRLLTMSAFEGTPLLPPQCGRHKWKPPNTFFGRRYTCISKFAHPVALRT